MNVLSDMNSADGPAGTDESRDLVSVGLFFGGAGLLGLLLTLMYGVRASGWTFQPHLIWALALWAAGVAVGFLFAIPRVLQGGRGDNPPSPPSGEPSPEKAAAEGAQRRPAYQQRVNTNLEEISDWLTKIIVGTGLIELRQLDSHIYRLGETVVASLPAPASPALGVGIVIYFSVTGFLFGYLVTRLYIQGALARAEQSLASEVSRADLAFRLVSAQTTLDALTEVAPVSPAMVASAIGSAEPAPDVIAGLQSRSAEYQAIRIADWSARLAAKNQAASRMVKYVVDNGVSRDWLASQTDEGLILALAATVQAKPLPGDGARVLRVAPIPKRLHVRYRIVLAFERLREDGMLSADERAQVLRALDDYYVSADESLRKLIDAARRQLARRS